MEMFAWHAEPSAHLLSANLGTLGNQPTTCVKCIIEAFSIALVRCELSQSHQGCNRDSYHWKSSKSFYVSYSKNFECKKLNSHKQESRKIHSSKPRPRRKEKPEPMPGTPLMARRQTPAPVSEAPKFSPPSTLVHNLPSPVHHGDHPPCLVKPSRN